MGCLPPLPHSSRRITPWQITYLLGNARRCHVLVMNVDVKRSSVMPSQTMETRRAPAVLDQTSSACSAVSLRNEDQAKGTLIHQPQQVNDSNQPTDTSRSSQTGFIASRTSLTRKGVCLMKTSLLSSEIVPASAMLVMSQVRNDHIQASQAVNSSPRSPSASHLGLRNNVLFNLRAPNQNNPQSLTLMPHSHLPQLLRKQMVMKSLPQAPMCRW